MSSPKTHDSLERTATTRLLTFMDSGALWTLHATTVRRLSCALHLYPARTILTSTLLIYPVHPKSVPATI